MPSKPALIIFDDDRGQFGPMTDLRASFELRTGEMTTGERIAAAWHGASLAYWVPKRLAALVAERAGAPVNQPPDQKQNLLVNGHWVVPDVAFHPGAGEAMVESSSEDVVAANLNAADAAAFLQSGELPDRVRRVPVDGSHLARFPWEILSLSKRTIAADILARGGRKTKRKGDRADVIGDHPILIDQTAKLFPGVVLDAELGPIAVHERAVIRPGAVLCGPCSVGRDSVIVDRSLIKPHTAIGPMCKVGGEVGATIFQGFSNKSHDGHLGDSWIGEWVNFGAGTTNSNLLNTYGEVTMRLEPDGPRHRTGTQFLGAIVGDHAKFAICTRLMTGTVIGTGAMIATTAPPPTIVKRFAWLTDEGERTYRFDKFLEVARTVMSRRKTDLSAAYVSALRSLHDRAAKP